MPHKAIDSLDLDFEDALRKEELREESYASSSPGDSSRSQEEQRQGLLADWNGAARDVEIVPAREHRRRSPRYFVPRNIALGLVLVFVFASAIAAVWQMIAAASSRDSEAQINPLPHDAVSSPTDYVLSADWDLSAPPQRRVYEWTITDAVLSPDGTSPHPMMVINGQFPGPLIELNEGDTVSVTVHNRAANATSIHWHGLFQNGTNHMDGAAGVTQCPIAPGASFAYEFVVHGQYGTYWYHSHQALQMADGLYGPLVVRSAAERALHQESGGFEAFDTDRVILLADYYRTPSPALLQAYLAPDVENAEPVPDGALINGRGNGNVETNETNGDASPSHFEFALEPGKAHRLRFVNGGAFAEFAVTLDGLDFAVVEVDGTAVEPQVIDRLLIAPGQRYSVVVRPPLPEEHQRDKREATEAVRTSWLRAKMLTGCFTDPPATLDPDVLARVYLAAAKPAEGQRPGNSMPADDRGPPLECRDLDTSSLRPLPRIPAPASADATFHLRANFEIGAYALSRGFFNASSFRPNLQRPTLHRAVAGLGSRNRSWFNDFADPSTPGHAHMHAWVNDAAFASDTELVIQTRGIRAIDLVVSNFDDGNHPLHLHGYKFAVLGQGTGYPPPDFLESAQADLTNPLRRDTASVEAFGWLWLRLVADNPGAWLLHCHVAWHAEAGLAMQLLTRADAIAKMQVPRANAELCEAPLEELRKGAAPGDEVYMHGTLGGSEAGV